MRGLPLLLLLALSSQAPAYPLDGYDYSGIRRLEFYRLAQLGLINGRQLPAGAQLPLASVAPGAVTVEPVPGQEDIDADYVAALRNMLGAEKNLYGIALIDLSDPNRPLYAEHNAGTQSNVGSVGKVLVALAVFQVLADLYPDDTAARERVLRETLVTTTEVIHYDHHDVPFWYVDAERFEHRPLRIGDSGSLWEFLDWMLSASSNAAASVVMEQLLLLEHFGRRYPVDRNIADAYFSEMGPAKLGHRLHAVMESMSTQNGIDSSRLRQGSFFTRVGKQRVAGTTSFGTPRSLAQLLLKLETGILVDAFSSRELKRLLYMTQKRIRYASHPALFDAAVYFKSGSLYSCMPEDGFVCRRYHGNRINILASIAIVESPAQGPHLRYVVAVLSNVLRKNSAVAHQTLAMRIHRMIEARHRALATGSGT